MERSTSITGFASHALARTPMRFFVNALVARADVHVSVVGGPLQGSAPRAVVDDVGSGRHCVRWEAATSGTYSISVSVNGTVVQGCPLTCTVAEPLTRPKCTAYGDGLLRATAGARAHFHVEVTDGETLSCVFVRGGVRLAGTIVPLSAAVFRVEYVAELAGEYQLELFVGGSRVEAEAGENVVRVEAGPVDGASSTVRWLPTPTESQLGLAAVRAGEPLSLELRLVDAYGNATATGGRARDERLAVGVEGVNQPALDWHIGTSVGDVDSVFVIRALPATSGEYRVHVTHAGLALRGSPVRVVVLPARAHLSELFADGSDARWAVAGSRATFALRHVGEDGQPSDLSELGELCATLALRRRPAGARADSQAHGAFASVRARRAAHGMCVTAFEVEYVTRAAGEHLLAVTTASGEHVPGSPFALAVAPAQADALSCELLAGAPTHVYAGQSWELVVRARDRFGNAWEVGGERGFAARLLAQPSGSEAAAVAAVLSIVDLHNGRYAIRLPSAPPGRAGDYRVEVTLRGTLVGSVELRVLARAAESRPTHATGAQPVRARPAVALVVAGARGMPAAQSARGRVLSTSSSNRWLQRGAAGELRAAAHGVEPPRRSTSATRSRSAAIDGVYLFGSPVSLHVLQL